MRTGIKTSIKKKVHRLHYPVEALFPVLSTAFPSAGVPQFILAARMRKVVSELKHRDVRRNLGALYTLPHPVATRVYKELIDLNPGNLGAWSEYDSKDDSTRTLEHDVIHNLIDLYHGHHTRLAGYVTSGATEGNLYSVWMGKEYLSRKLKSADICLLRTGLTHYSVHKAAAICAIEEYVCPLNEDTWSMDLRGLQEQIVKLHAKGYRGFLIPITLGYTTTGTSDNQSEIIRVLQTCKKQLPGVQWYCWVDAALNGFIKPFTGNYEPFISGDIQSLVVDFHKFGLVPYPAGIILYQKQLQSLVTNKIGYLSENITTILGSRSGIPAASIWMMIQTFGKRGYAKMINNQLKLKHLFLMTARKQLPKIQIITDADSLTCGLINGYNRHGRFPQRILDKYSLFSKKTMLMFYPKKQKITLLYKCYFLPHITERVVREFLTDLQLMAAGKLQ